MILQKKNISTKSFELEYCFKVTVPFSTYGTYMYIGQLWAQLGLEIEKRKNCSGQRFYWNVLILTLNVEICSRSLNLSYPRALSSNTIRGEKISSGQILSDTLPCESLYDSHVQIKCNVLRLYDAVRSDTVTNSYDWKLIVLIVEICLKVKNCSTINKITTTYLKIGWVLMRLLRLLYV